MKAKLIDSYRWASVTLDGLEFSKTEFRAIPTELAEKHSAILDIQKDEEPAPKKVEAPKPQPVIETESAMPIETPAETEEPKFERQSRKSRSDK